MAEKETIAKQSNSIMINRLIEITLKTAESVATLTEHSKSVDSKLCEHSESFDKIAESLDKQNESNYQILSGLSDVKSDLKAIKRDISIVDERETQRFNKHEGDITFLKKECDEIKKRQDDFESRPYKKYTTWKEHIFKSVINAIVPLIIGAIITYFAVVK